MAAPHNRQLATASRHLARVERDRKRGVSAPPVPAHDLLAALRDMPKEPLRPTPASPPKAVSPSPHPVRQPAQQAKAVQPQILIASAGALLTRGVTFFHEPSSAEEPRYSLKGPRLTSGPATHGYGSPVRRPWENR